MRLVLVGDSIRLGYQPHVAALVGPSVFVDGPDDNCRSTDDIVDRFDDWVPPLLGPGAVVHLNAGLHDLRRAGPDGHPQVPLDRYRSNLRRVVDRLEALPQCEGIVLATTTPVDGRHRCAAGSPSRCAADVADYNRVIVAVSRERSCSLNDLHAAIARDPGRLLSADGVHLSAAGNAVAARTVVDHLGIVPGR
jgi:lysophospholipase L1-like esterase